jgi:hypothetical protein
MKIVAIAAVLGLGAGAGVAALVKNAEQRGCEKGIVNILMEINPAVTVQLEMTGTLMPEVEKECKAALK